MSDHPSSSRTGYLFNLDFGAPQGVDTKQGPREVYYAPPNTLFWSAWSSQKLTMEAAGFRVFKDDDGDWRVAFWPHLSAQDALQRASSLSSVLIERREQEARRLDRILAEETGPRALKRRSEHRAGVDLEVIEGGRHDS
ncbi:hypothetical protein FIV42_00585 [Persicimonas caeni]|uniref:Uncharacterized protein n=1 Tax=Persicimonas caeni TaxID=2292766 RepID=A0A4Y6PLW4_PERCE|nr:hypothetical protein [Persicimonas caeni]QDG49281.1 hypothetical protein FIV42_00585 [Persicimonas caeni]QED30502.1 hypothetical protein FRD00_00580 [Persicimonas caeni]